MDLRLKPLSQEDVLKGAGELHKSYIVPEKHTILDIFKISFCKKYLEEEQLTKTPYNHDRRIMKHAS